MMRFINLDVAICTLDTVDTLVNVTSVSAIEKVLTVRESQHP